MARSREIEAREERGRARRPTFSGQRLSEPGRKRRYSPGLTMLTSQRVHLSLGGHIDHAFATPFEVRSQSVENGPTECLTSVSTRSDFTKATVLRLCARNGRVGFATTDGRRSRPTWSGIVAAVSTRAGLVLGRVTTIAGWRLYAPNRDQ